MTFDKLFTVLDDLIGDIATFCGLTFRFEHGDLTVDLFIEGTEGEEPMYICDFKKSGSTEEPIYFAAKGLEELKEQISHHALV